MDAPIATGGPMGADDRLRLLFTCCHPALNREAQVALTLRTIGGLETAAVARAFLVPEATIAQRLVRAKRKIRDAAIPYRVPDGRELPARLGEVLRVLYLIFNEGYLASSGDAGERRDLARDAEWLTSLLARLMPDEPEVLGLLALMRLHLARSDARFSADGALVLLPDQDRSHWDQAAIGGAVELLRRSERMGPPGSYQLQAAILGVHATSPVLARHQLVDHRPPVRRAVSDRADPGGGPEPGAGGCRARWARGGAGGHRAAGGAAGRLSPVPRRPSRAVASHGPPGRGAGGGYPGPRAHRQSSRAAAARDADRSGRQRPLRLVRRSARRAGSARFAPACSRQCAVQPAWRASANVAGNRSGGRPTPCSTAAA